MLGIVLFVVAGLVSSGSAWADVENATGTNVQEGDNRATTSQRGTGRSGDAVGGQVAGVVSSGRTSVDATNASRDSSVESGDVNGSNTARSFTGQDVLLPETELSDSTVIQDVTGSAAFNLQEGDNRHSLAQTVNALSGDGVGGQVIGVVTAGGGSTSVVAANTSEDVDVTTGDADGTNDSTAFVGQNAEDCFGRPGRFACEGGLGRIVDVTASTGANLQDGDNRLTSRQSANASTGDGVAGQVIGAVSAGATSIDATNRSQGVSVDTGDADAANVSDAFAGQNVVGCREVDLGGLARCGRSLRQIEVGDVTGSDAVNVQDGDNRATDSQSANANSGDGVAGEVIGAVTSAGGSTSIVAANTSRDSDVTTGDADATNNSVVFVGQNVEGCVAESRGLGAVAVCESFFNFGGILNAQDVDDSAATNLQEGDNRLSARQSAAANTGDGVAGQVIGAVSAGATSIDATNTSDRVSVDTGDATSRNDSDTFVGQNVTGCRATATGLTLNQQDPLVPIIVLPLNPTLAACGSDIRFDDRGTQVDVQDVTASIAANLQEGDNRASMSQAANATSGDGVAGEVIGAVTSAGGSASIVAANTSRDSDVSTGEADASNASVAFVGQNIEGCTATAEGFEQIAACESEIVFGEFDLLLGGSVADVSESRATNLQEGDNRLRGGQSANASSGDGVAGQVIGAVSAGATSIDATNRSEDVSVETGDASSANHSEAFVGQNVEGCRATASGGGFNSNVVLPIPDVVACESTVGFIATDVTSSSATNVQDGDNNKSFSQSADASSGDAVAGQVTGVVTSAGGSASVVVANTSTGIDSSTGESEFTNDDIEFVGLNVTGETVTGTPRF